MGPLKTGEIAVAPYSAAISLDKVEHPGFQVESGPATIVSISTSDDMAIFQFDSSKIGDAANSSATQLTVLNTAAHAVASQAKFPDQTGVTGLEHINDHLAAAQGHANNWLNTYSAEILSTLQSVQTFGDLFNNLYDALLTSAQKMANESGFQPNEISNLIAQISALQSQVSAQLTSTTTVYTDLSTYQNGVDSDISTFMTDYNSANSQLNGDQGILASLQARIDADHAALLNDALMIAGGTVGVVAGILCIVAGVGGAVESGGTTIAVVAAGVAMLGGGGAMIGLAGKDYDAKMHDLADTTTQLANAQAEITLLASLKTSFNGLNTQLKSTQSALQSLVSGWQELDNGLSQLITSLQAPEDYLSNLKKTDPTATPALVSTILQAELKTANDDWKNNVNIVSTILANLRGAKFLVINDLPTQENIQAAYHASAALAV